MSNPEIIKVPSVTYKLRNLKRNAWADITLREWCRGGSFQCQSSYGEFAYIWRAIGDDGIKDFLCSLDKDYFLKKTRPNDYMVFSNKLTCKRIKKDIIEQRKEVLITKEEAHQCWEECNCLESNNSRNSNEFFFCLEKNTNLFEPCMLVEKIYMDDWLSIPTVYIYNPQYDAFWDNVWSVIVEYWQKEQQK